MEAMRNLSDKLLNLSQNVSASVPNHLDAGMAVMLGTGVVLIAGAWAVVLTIAAAARPKDDAQSSPSGSRAAGE
jgi:hypothetical protein